MTRLLLTNAACALPGAPGTDGPRIAPATLAVEVWMRPWDSVAGTRWTRCTPPSKRRWL